IKALFTDKAKPEELAYMAGVMGRPLFWHAGLLVFLANFFLDSATLTRRFLKERTLYIEHVIFAHMPEYKDTIRVIKETLTYNVPVIKACGVIRRICEALRSSSIR
ncbi:MAG: hypothetical protein DRJ66_03865, partial [Thermoprotei archaeon]